MKYCIYHNNFLLYRTKDKEKAWDKAKKYSCWFDKIEVRCE